MSKQLSWESLVGVAFVIVVIIALFKILFWVGIIAVAIGGIWLIANFLSREHDTSWIPIIMIIVGAVLAIVSYQIGYEFERSEIGEPIVDSAEKIIEADNTIKEAQQDATDQIINATQQALNEVQDDK